MKQSRFGSWVMCVPLTLGLGLSVVACGGSDNSNGKNTGGSSSTSSGGSSSMSSAGSSSSSMAGGSSTPSGGNSTTTGGGDLPQDKPVNTLTDDEAKQLCEELQKDEAGLESFSCKLSGILAVVFSGADTDAKAQAACKAAYDECVAGLMTSTGSCDAGAVNGDCTATVAELEACMNDSKAAVEAASTQIPSCDTITLKDLMSGDTTPSMEDSPASCKVIEMKCPGALPSGM